MIVVIVAGGGNPKAFVNSTSCSVLVLALLEPEQDNMHAVVKTRRLLAAIFITLQNDERMHPYQRERTSITGLMLEIRGSIKTERLVGVVMSRLVLLGFGGAWERV